MGTRSFVGVMKGNVCRSIYVHWDGYLEGVGRLLQSYTTQSAAEELIEPGDRSSLTTGFFRDNGKTDVGPVDYSTFKDFVDAAVTRGAEYYYVFRDGVWYCGDTYSRSNYTLTPFSVAIELANSSE